jgi:hypothetical protein
VDPERVPVVDLVAALDQATAALVDVARMLGDYRRGLIAAGFEPDEALELCIEVQREVIFGGCSG